MGHPAAEMLLQAVNGTRHRNELSKPNPIDQWAQLSDGFSRIYFHDFASATDRQTFPIFTRDALRACVMPYRKLEPSAMMLAKTGYDRCAELEADAREPHGDGERFTQTLLEALKEELLHSCFYARAQQLAHHPCPLDVLVQARDASLIPSLRISGL